MFDVKHTLEDIQADPTKLVNIRVVDLREKPDLWRGHRIVVWQEKLELEDTT